jgi:kinesin family protein 18/19
MKSPPTCPGTVTVRRNPPRKARATPSTNAPQMPLVPSSSSTTTRAVPSFPIQDILSMEIPEKPRNPPQPEPSSSSPKGPISDNLKVYLRIRPLLPPKPSGRNGSVRDPIPPSRSKNAWPQNLAKKTVSRDKNAKKKNSGEACVTVSDSHSVTLSPPLAVQESNRIKSVVYEGFSHVFPPESSQVSCLFIFSLICLVPRKCTKMKRI